MKAQIVKTTTLAMLFSFLAFNALAEDERVFKNGNYWEVSSIEIVDGQWLNYATHLKGKWQESMEFSKSKGWISDYKILINQHPRKGEPDMYLVSIFGEMATKKQEDERYEAYMKWAKSSIAKMEEESGERVIMRHLSGNSLLREVTFR